MHSSGDPRNPDLTAGTQISGYRIDRIVELPEINGFFYHLTHKPTGARHIHISRPDPENAFSVTLKTVPADSTGVAHILEHTVLCGSVRYPVRDPFFSMMKRSLNTFMNALTASDWTMYPFATQNEKDYYNLMSVYLDAVFYPRLDPLSFKQEGHRLEFDTDPLSGDERLVYKGVVYNEMKGAMSSPDQVMARSMLNALYPDTTYSYNSGGDPEQIPKLTHEQLLAFHRHYYHPSNAFFYTYGSMPLVPHLKFIEETILNRFTPIRPDSAVPSQPRWEAPREATYTYPLDPAENPDKKSQACLAWLTADIRDAYEVLILSVLEQVLIGNPGAPLRKALMDSELGSTLSDGTGLDTENKDTMFSCGLKDIHPEDANKIEQIIFDVFEDLVENGIDRRLVDTAIHQIEFHRKEVSNVPFPYGLKLLLRFCGDWLHDGDPAVVLNFDSLLERFFHELETTPLLENRIRKWFLENPHRLRMILKPDIELQQKRQELEENSLEEIHARLTDDDIDQIKKDAETLQRLQESDEDLSCLPTLGKNDIPPDINIVLPSGFEKEIATDIYEQPTSGILYATKVFGIQALPAELIPMVPLFCYALTRCGTNQYDYVEQARRIDQYTGGLGFSISAGNRFSENGQVCMPMLTLSGKCLSRNVGSMYDLFADVLSDYAFTDHERLKHLLLEVRAEMESSVVHNGHRLAISLAARNFSISSALNEAWHGIHQLQTMKQLTDDLTPGRLKSITDDFYRIAEIVFHRDNIRAALIGEKTDVDMASSRLAALYDQLPSHNSNGFGAPQFPYDPALPREGWATSTAVSFVAKVIATQRMDHEDAPALAVISRILKSMFLHREIREKGGAYGGFAIYQMENGLFYFGSYRDPHIVNTLRVYEAAAEFITSGDYDEEDITEAILQVCSDIDRPDPPGPGASKAFYRKLIGLSDELRRSFKSNLLAVDMEKVQRVAGKYFDDAKRQSAVAVISSEKQLQAANEQMGDAPLHIARI